ncbi:hypothetical protein EKH55_4088 [Sinorhizobium alkalisoli]|nr:hypothetical protein EKH55_4088 [Sinorhizobium alkalisoli]
MDPAFEAFEQGLDWPRKPAGRPEGLAGVIQDSAASAMFSAVNPSGAPCRLRRPLERRSVKVYT